MVPWAGAEAEEERRPRETRVNAVAERSVVAEAVGWLADAAAASTGETEEEGGVSAAGCERRAVRRVMIDVGAVDVPRRDVAAALAAAGGLEDGDADADDALVGTAALSREGAVASTGATAG